MEHFGALNSFFEEGKAEILLMAEIGLKCVNSHESCPECYPHIWYILAETCHGLETKKLPLFLSCRFKKSSFQGLMPMLGPELVSE